MPRYTQGLMDLGATVCVPRRPLCLVCPLQSLCVAQREGRQETYPVRTRTVRRSSEAWWLLIARDGAGRIWMERRPARGIWAGLHCPPVHVHREAIAEAAAPLEASLQELPVFLHVLTHKDLHLHPVIVDAPEGRAPAGDGRWCEPAEWATLGLPAPVRKLLAALPS